MLLFTCLLDSPKVNYEKKRAKMETKIKTHTHKQIQRTKQLNFCYLSNNRNSISTVAPAIMQRGKKICVHIDYN
jgi:hypothetical protein